MTQKPAGKVEKSGGADIMDQLWKDTEQRIGGLRGGEVTRTSNEEFLSQVDALNTEAESVAQIKDKDERDIKTRVLQAKFDTLRKEAKTEEEDLAQAVLGLNVLMKQMGLEYEKLETTSDEEKALIQSAQTRLDNANHSLREAQERGFWGSLFGAKDRAILAANAEISAAQTNVGETDTRVKSMTRTRLLKADMEASLQQFTVLVEKTIGIMQDRIKAIEGQVTAVMHRKDEAFRLKQQAAEALEKLDAKLKDIEGSLQNEELVLGTLVNGSQEYVDQEKKISDLRVEVEQVRGRRNQALVLFQSKERFAQELEVHAKSQVMLRDNQRAWVTLLVSDTEERRVTFKSRLEAMKAVSDQDVAKNLDQVGVKIDQNNVDMMAKVASASSKARMEMVEAQPGRMKHITETQAALAAAQAAIRTREATALEEFRRRYGIDPMDASFFNKGDGVNETAPS